MVILNYFWQACIGFFCCAKMVRWCLGAFAFAFAFALPIENFNKIYLQFEMTAPSVVL